MNTQTRINKLEQKINNMSKDSEQMWICICGDDPCTCTEEHKLGKCKKYPSGSCVECKSSGIWRFMSEKGYLPTPIIDKEKLPELLEEVKNGERDFPIPILCGASMK